nr:hypothetical protein [Tanacetum cinerariifolium]
MTEDALWEVIVNGESPPPKRTVDGVEQTYPPTTAKEKLARKNELKARDENALVAQDRFRYNWSDQDKDGPINFALMAYTSSGEGYHTVPPPYTGNFMPLKPDLMLVDIDEYVVSEIVTSVPAVATNKAKT